jgi:cbb3-type cytochrome oxidase cytochrome c subunit
MKGLAPLFLGIFGTFAFSWAGMTLIPNYQIGHLDPQSDEEGTDIYPLPKSGMADRGRKIYAANGCVYCHSQQVRADYAASDIDRKWGTRRSAPRDYIFERPALLGKTRKGPDLSNIGKRAPSEDQNAAPSASASPSPSASSAASPAANAPAPAAGASPVAPPPATAAASPAASPAATVAGTSPSAPPPTTAAASPAATAAGTSPSAPPPTTAAASPAVSPAASPATSPANAATTADTPVLPSGDPPAYSAAWHHLHLYNPRAVTPDSNMPAYHFLYEKRRVSGERSADALKSADANGPSQEWEIVPTYDAKCLVAYLMSLDQSHELKEAKLTSIPATSPAPAKEEKK